MSAKIKAYLYIRSGIPAYFLESSVKIPFNIIEETKKHIGILPQLSIIYVDRVLSPMQTQEFSRHLFQCEEFKIDNSYTDHYPFLIISNERPEKNDDISYSLFNNTNIWFRCIDISKFEENDFGELENGLKYFNECYKMRLYQQQSAWEYIDYHLRIQKENQLNGGHRNILPNRYASEILSDELTIRKEKVVDNVGIRLLLIDDKINCLNGKVEIECTKTANDITESSNQECIDCKLRIIKELFVKDKNFCEFEPVWTNKVKAYKINDKNDIAKIKDESEDVVQIIGVNSIKFAQRIMACKSLKFDLILLDYYFHKNNKENYGIELLKFIEQEQKRGVLEKLRQNIRQNAGLENRLWIFPITAFPSSFLTHLHSENVPLLTNKWYIYTPTNPIVTPKHFLYNLNEFIVMMIDRSVYTKENLIKFFAITCEGILSLWGKSEDKNTIEIYVPFIGAEYRRFIQLYDSRLNIYRDKDISLFSKSIWGKFYAPRKKTFDDFIELDEERINSFIKRKIISIAKCILKKHKSETKKKIIHTDLKKAELMTLNFLMRKFFYASAYLTDDRNGVEKLRIAWFDLRNHLKYYFNIEAEYPNFNTFSNVFQNMLDKIIKQRKDI